LDGDADMALEATGVKKRDDIIDFTGLELIYTLCLRDSSL